MKRRQQITPTALRAWRASFPAPSGRRGRPPAGLSQTVAAARLGAGLRTYQAWEAGERRIPRHVPIIIGRTP